MKSADLSELTTQITSIAKHSPLGERVMDVVVEAEDDADGSDFLRVILRMRDLDNLEPEEVEPLVTSIEDAVALIDERFPSVRFADAA